MNKKILMLIIFLIIVIAGIALVFTMNEDDEIVETDITNNPGEKVSKYIMEEKKTEYSSRILESENKEYVTLFIETNLIQEDKKIFINYNSEKLLLNTANPLLENVEISKNGNINTFELGLEKLQNYSIIFIKKSKDASVFYEDITINF